MQSRFLTLIPHSLLVVVTLTAGAGCNKLSGQSGDGGGEGGGSSSGASLAFLSGFEGEIDGFFKDSKPGATTPNTPVSLFVKSGKVRFEIPEALVKGAGGPMANNPFGNKGYAIIDSATKKLSIVSDAEKEAVILDLNTAGKMVPPSGGLGPGGHGGSPQGTPPKVTKTGKTDTVAGYKCEYWDVASDHKEGTVCVSDDGPSWMSLPMTGIPTERAWVVELLDGKHFPLRFISYGKDGTTEEERIEVTKIDKKPLADTQFQVPAGYRTMDLGKLMQGIGMPGGGMPGMLGGGSSPGPHPPPHGGH